MILDASAGVEAQTRTVWRQAERNKVRLLFKVVKHGLILHIVEVRVALSLDGQPSFSVIC